MRLALAFGAKHAKSQRAERGFHPQGFGRELNHVAEHPARAERAFRRPPQELKKHPDAISEDAADGAQAHYVHKVWYAIGECEPREAPDRRGMRRTKEHFHPPLVGGDGGSAPISTQGRVERVGRTEFASLAQPAAQLAGAI